jgi:tape measure domain-containing protein
MTIITRVVLAADSSQVRQAAQDMDKLQGAGEKTNSTVATLGRAFMSLAGPIAAALSVRQIVDYTNRWTDLNSRLVNATKDSGLARDAMARIADVARRTYSDLELTADAFLRNSMTLTELGYSTGQQLDLMEALNNALVISGTKGAQAESVMDALGKAFAFGELRGQNFNTVIQSGGRIVEALAAGLGVSTLELRRMAGDGLLPTGVVVEALTSQLSVLRDEADAMPATIGDAFKLFGNSILELVGTLDQASNGSSRVATALVAMSDGIRNVNDVMGRANSGIEVYAGSYFRFNQQLEHSIKLGMSNADTIHGMRTAVMLVKAEIDAATQIYGKNSRQVQELQTELRRVEDRLMMFGTAQVSTTSATEEATAAIEDNSDAIDDNVDAIRKKIQELDRDRTQLTMTEREQFIFNATVIKGEVVTGEYAGALRNAAAALYDERQQINANEAAQKALNEATQQAQQYTDRVTISSRQKELQLVMTGRQAAIYNAIMSAGTQLTTEQMIAIEQSVGSLYDQEQALRATEQAQRELAIETERSAAARTKAEEDAAKAQQKLLAQTHEYMTKTLLDIWENGSSVFQKIGDAFVAMVKRMVAEWAASQLMNLFGMGGASASNPLAAIGQSAIGTAAKSVFGGGTAGGGGLAGVGASVVGGAKAAGSSIMGAASAIPGWGWALAGTAAVAALLSDKSTPSANAGMLVGPAPGVSADRKFSVAPFASGFQPTGFARREDQSTAMQIIDAFAQVDSALTEAIRLAGGHIDMSAATLAGFSETGQGAGVFLGMASEKGKGVISIPLEQQLSMYAADVMRHAAGLTAEQKAAIFGGVHGSHASGLSYVPFDGYRAELHRGEEVLRASDPRNINNLASMSDKMEQLTMQVALYSRRMSQILDDWNARGLPPERLA